MSADQPTRLEPQYSVRSKLTVDALEDTASVLRAYEAAVDKAAAQLANPPPSGLSITLRSELAQLYGNVNKLLEENVDATTTMDLNTGKQDAKAQKKELTHWADALIVRVQALIAQLDARKRA
mmetsp:Transcript_47870/g.102274  ORF Transcript_47870/g.102274 Transcript_47870/m.102274 type:complete len:123 (-) Transcript_47870:347-715(-)|eukprot:CAMPEP_0183330664 /NCGR_PEP_ID=MMETSP0164_2-20130417/41_1 /TAXON_ID=221442 /ORGANISM="Coccolithus pelagicus ssp braarudi, Strain PLY182g" /LENGTH=122 /DNA_ID=CAMNT_0025498889 /DNA_START=107 /DNA_END=475 /DNA_ORIENTATION=+